MSLTVDKIIDEVSDSWIRIREQDTYPQGMFDYSYTDGDLVKIYPNLGAIKSFDAFVDAIFTELRQRTDLNLELIRHAISKDVTQRLTDAISKLKARLHSIVPATLVGEFDHKVVQFRTDLQHEMAKVAGWFTIADEKAMTDFDFEKLVQAVVAVVQKCYPNRAIQSQLDLDVTCTFRGSTFMHFWDVLFNVLDNVYKHAGDFPTNIIIKANVVKEWLNISISNNLSPSVNVEAIRARLEELRAHGVKAVSAGATKKEGGTGYLKLLKILLYDLRRDHAQAYMEWSVDINPLSFKVDLKMSLNGLTV